MNNSWTWSQYSVFRCLFGFYLFIHFMDLTRWGGEMFSSQGVLPDANLSPLIAVIPNLFHLADSPFIISATLILACIASLLLMAGIHDRIAAFFLWVVLIWLLGRNPLILNPSMPYVGWMLVAHLFVPAKPLGALSARRQQTPDSHWQLPSHLYFAAWAVLACSYSYSGYTKLLSPSWVSGDAIAFVINNPLARDTILRDWLISFPPYFFQLLTWFVLYSELFFLPLSLVRQLRPCLWMLLLIIQFGFLLLLNFADLTIGMLIFHLLTLNPGWIKAKPSYGNATLFYDAHNGLSTSMMRFVMAEDKKANFTLSPYNANQHPSTTDAQSKTLIPGSILAMNETGETLKNSSAIIDILQRLGGLWVLLGHLIWIIPKPLRDFGYQIIAKYCQKTPLS